MRSGVILVAARQPKNPEITIFMNADNSLLTRRKWQLNAGYGCKSAKFWNIGVAMDFHKLY
jgi:hypothetical protein